VIRVYDEADNVITLAPSTPAWVGLLVFGAMVAFMLIAFISALRHVIYGT
jgi:hypothetical protein